jgi:DNA ligase 1
MNTGFTPELNTNDMSPLSEEAYEVNSQRRQGIMLCYPFEEKRLEKWGNSTVFIQPKLDGERCRAIIKDRTVTLLSSEENVITSVPHINRALLRTGLDNIELDGELYLHGMTFEEIHSRVSRKVNMHARAEDIQYHIFDIVSAADQLDRLFYLNQNLIDYEFVRRVSTSVVSSTEEIMETLHRYTGEGYEGVIVRHLHGMYVRRRSTQIMKFKPKKHDTYQIVGFQEEISKEGNPKNSLGALICRDNMGTRFNVGSGFTAEQRQKLWQEKELLVGRRAVVNYQHLTPGKHVPRFPVFVEVK